MRHAITLVCVIATFANAATKTKENLKVYHRCMRSSSMKGCTTFWSDRRVADRAALSKMSAIHKRCFRGSDKTKGCPAFWKARRAVARANYRAKHAKKHPKFYHRCMRSSSMNGCKSFWRARRVADRAPLSKMSATHMRCFRGSDKTKGCPAFWRARRVADRAALSKISKA